MGKNKVKYNLVFLIDDSESDINILELVLNYNNFSKKILKFSSAIEALSYLESPSSGIPDLIFLDLNMPVMNGFGFLDEVKKIPHLEEPLNVILLTSSDNIQDMEKAKHYLNIKKYLIKPITSAALENL